jgi:hypothetical protein
MTLTVGQFGFNDELTPGSMAQMIEHALESLVPLGTNENPIARRKLALAIARGVVEHLRDNLGSLQVYVPNSGGGGAHVETPFNDVDLGAWP